MTDRKFWQTVYFTHLDAFGVDYAGESSFDAADVATYALGEMKDALYEGPCPVPATQPEFNQMNQTSGNVALTSPPADVRNNAIIWGT